jgi:tetratricopeptide (TPR) repeat protein
LQHLDSDHWVTAYCLLYRSYIASAGLQAGPALRYAQQALEHFHQAPPLASSGEGLFLGAIGEGYHLGGRNREADQYYRMAVQKYVEVGRESSANAISLRNEWAVVLDDAGAPKRALDIYDGTLALIREHHQDEQPPPYLLGNRARALESIGRFEEARAAYERELEMGEEHQNPESQAHALSGLASAALAAHDPSACSRYLARFAAILAPWAPPGTPPWRSYASLQARLTMEGGKFAEAREQFSRALENLPVTSGLTVRLGRSEAALRAGDAEAAASDARVVLDAAQMVQGNLPYSDVTGLAWLALGRAQRQLGQSAQARQSLSMAEQQLSNVVDANHPALVEIRNLLYGGDGAPGRS